jgi:hypothetical protein
MIGKLLPPLAATAVLLGSCGSSDPQAATTTAAEIITTTSTTVEQTTLAPSRDHSTTTSTSVVDPVRANGTLAISLQPIEGVFIEGFEIAVRVETSEGEVLYASLWTDYIKSTGDMNLRNFYDSVLTQAVPAGPVVILATVNIGIGPGPITPDLFGDLKCRLETDVPAGGETQIQIAFDSQTNCLSQII